VPGDVPGQLGAPRLLFGVGQRPGVPVRAGLSRDGGPSGQFHEGRAAAGAGALLTLCWGCWSVAGGLADLSDES
jgi:hypothetical protein